MVRHGKSLKIQVEEVGLAPHRKGSSKIFSKRILIKLYCRASNHKTTLRVKANSNQTTDLFNKENDKVVTKCFPLFLL